MGGEGCAARVEQRIRAPPRVRETQGLRLRAWPGPGLEPQAADPSLKTQDPRPKTRVPRPYAVALAIDPGVVSISPVSSQVFNPDRIIGQPPYS